MSILKLKDSQGNWISVPTLKGDKGNGIQSAVLNNDYTLTLTFTDGTTYTTPSIRGEKGEQGEPATDMDIHICSASEYDSETRIPTITSPNDKTFYLVPTENGASPDLFTEWVYVNNAWEMFGSMKIDLSGYLTDVTVNGTSVVNNGVAEIPIANNFDFGLVKIGTGIGMSDGKLNLLLPAATDIKSGLGTTNALFPLTQHHSTFYGLAKAAGHDEKDSTLPVGQYTDEAKSSIQDMLDVPSNSELKEVNDSKADVIVESASGDIVSFDDGADDMPLKSLVVDINPVQDLNGYDSPWVGGGGKNLLDSSLLKDQEAWNIIPIKVKPNTAYTASTDKPSLSAMPAYFTINNTGGGGGSNNLYVNHSVTITSTEDGYVYFSQRRASGEDSFANYHFQVEEGSTATDWTPYENVCPINGWTGCEVNATGKNLLSHTFNNATISTDGTIANSSTYYCKASYIKAGKTYYTNSVLAAYHLTLPTKGDGVPSYDGTRYNLNGSFVAPIDGYVILRFPTSVEQPMMSLDGSDYEPYKGQSIPISWQTEAGTVYGGNLDVPNGMLTVEKFLLTLDGTVGFLQTGASIPYWRYNPISAKKPNYYKRSETISNKYSAITSGSTTDKAIRITGDNNGIYVYDSDFVDSETAISIMQAEPIQILYPLLNPIEIQLTPHEITSLLGHNTIYANTGNTSVEYCADTELYIEKVKPSVNVDDVQINNTSIVNDGIANIPFATSDTAGVVKVDPYTNAHYGGIVSIDNKLFVVGSPFNGIKYGGDYSKPVVAGNQHYSTFYGLAKAAGADEKDSTLAFGTYSDNAKSSIQNMLGITDKYSPKEWVAESETELVTNAHSVGDLFYIGETLYKVIADLNAGDAINVGVNVEEVNANDILDDYATKEDVQDNVSIVEKSVSGSVASFDDGMDDMPLKSLTVDINPTQDLHGYDLPWIGGGGKNKFDIKNAVLAVGYNAVFRSNGYAQVNVYTTDTGIASDEKNINCGRAVCLGLLPAGTYILSYVNNSGVTLSFTVSYTTTDVVPQDGQLERTSVATTDNQSIQFEADGSSYYWFGAYSKSAESYKIDDIMVRLASETDATFTPYENICPISGWTGANVAQTGKNLFDKNSYLSYKGYFEGREIVYNVGHLIVYIRCMPNTTYTVSRQRTVINERFAVAWTKVIPSSNVSIYNKKSSTNSGTVGDWMSLTITTGEDAKYLAVWAWWNSSVNPSDTFQIELSDTMTDYAPYQGQTIPISWQTEAGTVYGGKLDVLSGVLRVDMAMYTFDGSEAWVASATPHRFSTNTWLYLPQRIATQPMTQGAKQNILTSVFGECVYTNADGVGYVVHQSGGALFVVNEPTATTVNDIKAMVTGMQFCYELAEPIEIQLTPNEVNSFLGANNIWADTGDTSVEYFSQVDKDLIDYIETSLKPYAKEERLNDYVCDVQVDGTSIVADGVANVPVAGSGIKGVVSVISSYGLNVVNGNIAINRATGYDFQNANNNFRPIVTSEQHNSVFYGLAKAAGDTTQSASSNTVGNYTDEAKTAIKQMLGVHDTIDSFVEEVTGTDVTITGQPSYRYNCGELYSLTVTPPSSGTIDIRFTSGSTPTVLTLPSTVKMPEWWVEVEANTIYEMCITDGIYCGVMTWAI